MGFGVSLKSAWGVDCFEETNAKLETFTKSPTVKDNRRAYKLPTLSTAPLTPPQTVPDRDVPSMSPNRDEESKKLFFVVGLGLFLIVIMDFMVKLGAILS